MGKSRALRLGIMKGVEHVAKVALPQTWKCRFCGIVFKAVDVAIQAKQLGIPPEQIIGEHIIQHIKIGNPFGKVKCPDCGDEILGKDVEEHMKKHPIGD